MCLSFCYGYEHGYVVLWVARVCLLGEISNRGLSTLSLFILSFYFLLCWFHMSAVLISGFPSYQWFCSLSGMNWRFSPLCGGILVELFRVEFCWSVVHLDLVYLIVIIGLQSFSIKFVIVLSCSKVTNCKQKLGETEGNMKAWAEKKKHTSSESMLKLTVRLGRHCTTADVSSTRCKGAKYNFSFRISLKSTRSSPRDSEPTPLLMFRVQFSSFSNPPGLQQIVKSLLDSHTLEIPCS